MHLRTILDAIFYVLRTGCPWHYLPATFPPWQTVFCHFRRFRLQGIWHLLYTALHRAEREHLGRIHQRRRRLGAIQQLLRGYGRSANSVGVYAESTTVVWRAPPVCGS
jgi:transposase